MEVSSWEKSSISMGHGFHGYVTNNQRVNTMWGPQTIVNLVYNSNKYMIYGTQITIVFMGFIKQQT